MEMEAKMAEISPLVEMEMEMEAKMAEISPLLEMEMEMETKMAEISTLVEMEMEMEAKMAEMKIKVVEISLISPPPNSVTEATFPLNFFDVIWLMFPPVQRLLFYNFSDSTTHFVQSLLPPLKSSLSLALQHFYSLAGQLALSPETDDHKMHFVEGGSVTLTVTESDADFNQLVADHPKDATKFHPLAPQLPKSSLLALQITVFPNSGICIGITLNHVVADGRSLAQFLKSWASICRTGDPSSIKSLPFYDRSVIGDPKGLKKIFLEEMAKLEFDEDFKNMDVCSKVEPIRATFVLSRLVIERMRQWVLAQRPNLAHCTPFVVTCAYVWVCLIKTFGDIGDKTVHFSFSVDSRARLNPPVPITYFGNCIVVAFAEAKGSDLIKEDGVATAAESIGRSVLGLGGGVLAGAEDWFQKFRDFKGERVVSVAGSPKFRVYDTNFGWGRPRKTEVLSIEKTGAIYLGESRDGEGVEIGLALPKSEMGVFTSSFEEGLLNFSIAE